MTGPNNHKKKAIHVKRTWGKRCNELIFMSSEEGSLSVNILSANVRIRVLSPGGYSHTDKTLPAVALPVGEGRENLWGKTREAYRHVWENYRDKADWFMKADDDTYVPKVYFFFFSFWFFCFCFFGNCNFNFDSSYVVLENLRYMLSTYNSSEPIAFGHKFKPFVKQGYFSGGAGT